MNSVFKKTRIAPTPSGFLHLGNILSFSLTAALAEKTGASTLLRIDDLDRDRTTQTYIQDIFDTLHFLEIPWHEGPSNAREFEREYSQLHRMALYQKALQQLQDTGAMFACACSRSQIVNSAGEGAYPGTCRDRKLPLHTPGTSWRLRTPGTVTLQFNTYPEADCALPLPPQMQDFVVRKKDGFPAYQLTSLTDDLHYGIDLIVRGNDLLPSTLAQLYLARVLDKPAFSDAAFFHHPLLKTPSGVKLSKSAGDTSIRHLRLQGLKPPAVYTLIAGQLGLREPARNWEELAGLAMSVSPD